MSDYTKPLPRPTERHGEFYAFCKQHELRFQQCSNCGTWRHMPRETCPECSSIDWTWEPSSGRGTLFSWTVIHRALHPGWADDIPYAAVVIEMEEGVRLVSRLESVALDELAIGLPVEVTFEDVTPEVTLHKFRPLSSG